jgi:hypothetical protein
MSKLGRIIFGHSPGPCLGQGASLAEEAVLADSGREDKVVDGVGRVRNQAFLSILREWFPRCATRADPEQIPASC